MSNKNILISILTFGFILCLFVLAFAEIPIYCPKCKTHLYNYQKDVIEMAVVKAKDFLPASEEIKQPLESSPMVCPLCSCPLNLYESWAFINNEPPPIFAYQAISLLTKDKDGNFKGVPHDVKYEDWERKR